MPNSCAERRIKLIIEYNRLRSWAENVGLMEDNRHETYPKVLSVSHLEVPTVLSSIRTILESIAELYGRYEELKPDKTEQEVQAEQKDATREIVAEISTLVLAYNEKGKTRRSLRDPVRKTLSGLGAIFKHPKRILWVLVDETAFDNALNRLHDWTSQLSGLLGGSRLKAIQDTVETTFMEMVQLTETQNELIVLVQAAVLVLAESQASRTEGTVGLRNELQTLHDLAKLKQLNTVGGLANPIPSDRIQYRPEEGSRAVTMAIYQIPEGVSETMATVAGPESRRVWIEWKSYDVRDLKGGTGLKEEQGEDIRSAIASRTASLSGLLAHPKPAEFRTPNCLGYIDERENYRFGWIFAMPTETVRPPESLRSLFANTPRPSLTDRFALASRISVCLLYLHAVNWLHKAIRSDNILFLYDGDIPDLTEPILSGFDLSRPDTDSAKTLEKTDANPKRDIYRWPSSQTTFADENRSRKTFDIYSLGIVLLEIAHWRPIETIMGFPNVDGISASQSLKIRSRILEDEPNILAQILEMAGRRYHNATKACLKGPEAFGLVDGDSEVDPSVAIKLQRMYIERVVQELKRLDV